MARASTETILSLDRYAKILGISPAHFNGGIAASVNPQVFPATGACGKIYQQYSWQGADQVAREDIARAIKSAEDSIHDITNSWIGAKFTVQDIVQWPRYHRRAHYLNRRDNRGFKNHVKTNDKNIISPGRRGTTLIEGGATVTYTDEDNDGLEETATIVVSTTITDIREVRTYFVNENADPIWEVRPPRSITISGGNATIVFWSWQLIDPDLWDALPTSDGFGAIDISTTDNYVATVDVYREYVDTSQDAVSFFWDENCSSNMTLTEQGGTFLVRDAEMGLVVPHPATYADGAWSESSWSINADPSTVKLWYQSGFLSQKYLNGTDTESVSDFYAWITSMIATARLERPLCACPSIEAVSQDWQRDMRFSSQGSGSWQVTMEDLSNPIGTKKGEIMAWRMLYSKYESVDGGAI